MRKTTKHGRKLRRLGVTSSEHEKQVAAIVTGHKLTHTIAMHQPYDHETNVADADRIMSGVRMSLYKMANGLVPKDDEHHFFNLCDHIGAAQMRCAETEGDVDMANSVMDTLNSAGQALRRAYERHQRTQTWGLDGPGLHELSEGVTAGETLMRASTPAQMRRAQRAYYGWRDTGEITRNQVVSKTAAQAHPRKDEHVCTR
jgi:hypothetical protein